MIVLRERVAASPAGFWRWVLVALFAAAVIAGLLGMHTLSTAHQGPTITSSVAIDQGHTHHDQPATSSDCADCSGGDHDALMMICVLAVLAALIFFSPSLRSVLHIRGPNHHRAVAAAPLPRLQRPPSLVELSISRT